MTAADVLHARLFVRADEVVEIARAVGVDVAVAAVLLEKESGGGQNVWGRDAVETGGAYVKGSPVTREAYLQYREAVGTRRAGRQGVGPTQLTYGPLQDQADRLGGCWDWRTNVRVGLLHLKGLLAANGVRNGFRAYNGSGPAAEAYADDAVRRLALWQARLANQNVTTIPPEEPDMPITDADARLIVKTLLDTPLSDLYPAVPVRTMSVGDTLAWAAAHAARAESAVKALKGSA